EAYQARLADYAALDYDDILLEALELFENDADGLQKMREQHPHVLVDEFQDVNAVQYRLVKCWAGEGENLFVIGDPDQAIYGFRGASHEFFSLLEYDYEDAQWIPLELSYRARPAMLKAASAVISHNPDRFEVALKPTREGGVVPRTMEVASEKAEGIAVVREIGRMVGGATMLDAHGEREDRALGGAPDESWGFSDAAVLFRTARQADVMEECFIKEGIPYRVVGQRSFLEAPSVRDALTFLRCVVVPEDRFRFVQCLDAARFRGSRRLSPDVLKKADNAATVGEAWLRDRLGAGAFEGSTREKLEALVGTIDEWREKQAGLKPRDAVALWMEETEQSDDENLKRVMRLAAAFDDLGTFLDRVLICQDTQCERYGSAELEAVTLMTLHAAKGLEFPVVFIAGVEEGLIPLRGVDVDEERRLFYVGMTRAKDHLVLLHARGRTVRGKKESPEPSRFIQEIPPELIEQTQIKLKRKPKDRQLNLF
ncbi:UvrD-helicase domain-containing protein, partial [PVC group bacterium]|nr:UvrD-helicase domain-containing protein [PVC group bacterium]